MGNHSSISRIILLLISLSIAVSEAGAAALNKGETMSQAERVIIQFQKGGSYQPPPSAFMDQGKIVDRELPSFASALCRDSAQVREQVVRLLADLGKRSDPLYSKGGQLLRQPQLLNILTKEALLKDDLGREAALDAMQLYTPAPSLQAYGLLLSKDLEKWPGPTAFLLIAKVKPAEAEEVVEKLIATPRWESELKARVAAAALGDKAIEEEFIEVFRAETEPKEKAQLAKILGWIGTAKSLSTLAQAMRTELVIELPQVMRRSVRLDVLAALSYNFPEEQILFESQILTDDNYEQAEKFCEQHFGTKWDSPRPPFLTVMGFPVPVPTR